MNTTKFQIIRGENEKYYFRLRACNGSIILRSEAYKVRAGAEKGIDMVKLSALHDERFKRKISTDGKFYFDLVAYDEDIIGTSELYNTRQGCEKCVEAVKDDAPVALIENVR